MRDNPNRVNENLNKTDENSNRTNENPNKSRTTQVAQLKTFEGIGWDSQNLPVAFPAAL